MWPPAKCPACSHALNPANLNPIRREGPGAGIRQALALATCGSLGPGQAGLGPDIGPISHYPGRPQAPVSHAW